MHSYPVGCTGKACPLLRRLLHLVEPS
uniref:Uncharacterized protein n=1 Tax=Anguilla anguilla TaxID=7936 RepID=A0A0E9Q9J7_ANGAN